MFGRSRKNRPPPPPLTRETANPNAATAAASAFMRREPSVSLSSAAAAAALKARPTTPTNVAEVQTKRTLRRSPSISSTASRDRGRDRARGSQDLHRSPSAGSMTERTFRSPSPGPGTTGAPRDQDVPPVPSIPRDRDTTPRRSPSVQSHNSTASYANNSPARLQTQNFRTASQKLKDGQQGSWFGAATTRENVAPRGTTPVPPASSSTQVNDPRASSPSPSINFSYPRSRLESPAPSTASEQALVYDANSRRMVPKSEKLFRSQSLRDASEKPPRKKKSDISRSGSHLAKGTVGRTQVAAVEPPRSPPQTRTNRYSAPVIQSPPPETLREQASPTPERTPQIDTQPAGAQQPVQPGALPESEPKPVSQSEFREPSRPTPDAAKTATAVEAVAAVPSAAFLSNRESPARREEPQVEGPVAIEAVDTTQKDTVPTQGEQVDTSGKELEQQDPEILGPVPSCVGLTETAEDPDTGTPQPQIVRHERVHSESPARSAHFAPTADQLLVRHEPPPRSLSPRKSAMKRPGSIRGASPSDDSSEASAPRPTPIVRDEPAKKKSVHVSFNDSENVVVGESATPPEPLPPDAPLSPQQAKKSWHGFLGRRDKMTNIDDSDTMAMSPRPALPQFGSVREKKHKEPDSERPLVRPSERTWSPSPPAPVSSPPPKPALKNTDAVGTSSDSAIGSVLAQDSSARNEANISRTREPLPPVVTSIEATGYDSSSVASSDIDLDHSDMGDDDTSAAVDSNTGAGLEPIPDVASGDERSAEAGGDMQTTPDSEMAESNYNGPANPNDMQIPTISIASPTPPAQEDAESSPDNEYFDIPGGFPEEEKTREKPATTETPSSVPINTSRDSPVDESQKHSPPPSPTRPESIPTSTAASAPMADIQEEEENSDNGSIYSDAYEDMSEAEEGGFMSLDAVLTAPAGSKISKIYEKTRMKSQEGAAAPSALTPTSGSKTGVLSGASQAPDDWENAKAYWRNLSIEKRRQLEKEAIEEAGEDADLEDDAKKTTITKKASRPVSSHNMTAGSQSSPVYQPDSQVSTTAAPKFRKSMRGEQPAPVVEKGRQAAQISGSMRKTMRTNGTSEDERRSATTRPASYHQPLATVETPSPRRPQSIDGHPASSGGLGRPSPKRRGSDSSESSFRRSRPVSQGFGFRSTMRAQEPESPMGATKGSGRFSLRSLSPTGSSTFRRGSFSSPPPEMAMGGGGTRMRQSLRSQGASSKKNSRNKVSSFGRSSGKKATLGKGGSRFADSSDEDEGPRMHFHSRFADSSDEDERAAPAPQGGLARGSMRSSKGASSAAAAALGVPATQQYRTDSPEPMGAADMAIYQPKRNDSGGRRNGSGTLQRSRSGRGTLIQPTGPGKLQTDNVGSERPTHHRRGSFMSSILRRKKDDTGKISRDIAESGARRDTRLERSTEHLNMIRSNSGRLHKREPSWPLHEGHDNDDDTLTANYTTGGATDTAEPQRPSTATEPRTAQKSGFLKRRSISHQGTIPATTTTHPIPEDTDPATTPAAALPPKKKFGTLRKMFRLND